MTDTKTFTLSLGPLDSEHVGDIRAWRNDYRIWQFTRQNDYLDDLEHADWFKRQASDPTVKMYRVDLGDGETSRVVGVCGFTSIDYRNSRAEFSLYIAPGFQRQGLGRQALKLLVAHGFENHGFRLIWGETFDGNPAARMFEGLGFKREGTRRQYYYKGGRHLDAHLYSILKSDWETHGKDSAGAPADHHDGGDNRQLPAARRADPKERGHATGGDCGGAGHPVGGQAAKAPAKSPKRRAGVGQRAEGAARAPVS